MIPIHYHIMMNLILIFDLVYNCKFFWSEKEGSCRSIRQPLKSVTSLTFLIFPARRDPDILPRKISFHGHIQRDALFAEKVLQVQNSSHAWRELPCYHTHSKRVKLVFHWSECYSLTKSKPYTAWSFCRNSSLRWIFATTFCSGERCGWGRSSWGSFLMRIQTLGRTQSHSLILIHTLRLTKKRTIVKT